MSSIFFDARAFGRSMPRAVDKATAVDAYLAAQPLPHRKALEKLRAQILAAAPKATEKIAYGIPTFVHEGNNLVHMAAFKEHCSFFPGSGGVARAAATDARATSRETVRDSSFRDGVALALADELKGYKLAKGTIQFRPDKPIPAALVKRIVKMRVAENEARAAKKGARKPAKKSAKKPAKKLR